MSRVAASKRHRPLKHFCPDYNLYFQTLRSDSLLVHTSNMIRTRLGLTEIGSGTCRPLKIDYPSVFAIRYDGASALLRLANLSRKEIEVQVEESDPQDFADICRQPA